MSSHTPLVTVVTVTFNAGNLLEETISSIISQDYPNIEYIIIDGGSQDNTLNIIDAYQDHIHYWISEPDKGIYDAMNKGITKANGEWINFMNAGDTFFSRTTISEISHNFSLEYDLIAGDIQYHDNGEVNYCSAKGLELANHSMFCHHQALFTRTRVMKDLRFNATFRIAGDYDFVMRCLQNGKSFKFIDLLVAKFASGGAAETNKIEGKIENLFIQSKYLENINDIFKTESFTRLKSYNTDNNWNLNILLNNLFSEFERLKLKDRKFALYGYGHVGKLVHQYFKKNISLIVDKNYANIHDTQVKDTDNLKIADFDYILITVLGREEKIQQHLVESLNIPVENVLTFQI